MKPGSHIRNILVYAQWVGMKEPVFMGELRGEYIRQKEVFSFSYSEKWLKSKYSQLLDPELLFFSGSQYLSDEKVNFGMFLDSSPDRWGRILMDRREAALARRGKRAKIKLRESDYLLGVFDEHRMGALRFRDTEDGPFMNNNKEFASPPWTSIMELEQISLKLEDEASLEDPEYLKWLTMLVNPGSSLGGSRPKANVLDEDHALWIAKFPGKSDEKDIGGWEIVTNELARDAGLHIARSMAQKFSGKNHTFLTKRFDRTKAGERIHFASAMTILGHKDGANYQNGASYLEIVDFLTNHGASVDKDLRELWSRIVFNIFVANTDDHLRNHGFLLHENGWVLSPAYDVNPNEYGTGLSLNISLDDNTLSLELALEVAGYFRLSKATAMEIIEKTRKSVGKWRTFAKKYKLPKSEQEVFAQVFERFL